MLSIPVKRFTCDRCKVAKKRGQIGPRFTMWQESKRWSEDGLTAWLFVSHFATVWTLIWCLEGCVQRRATEGGLNENKSTRVVIKNVTVHWLCFTIQVLAWWKAAKFKNQRFSLNFLNIVPQMRAGSCFAAHYDVLSQGCLPVSLRSSWKNFWL